MKPSEPEPTKLSLKVRLIIWFVVRTLKKELDKMKPLPKWAGWLGAILAVIPSAIYAYQQGGWQAALAVILSALGGGTALLSHSAVGTGGTSDNP